MLLNFSYEMHDSFSLPVQDHHFSLMCLPRDTDRQRVLECHAEISPCSYQAEDKDFFGNRYLYGEAIAPHDSFQVTISGVVETGLAPDEHHDSELLPMFRLQTAMTAPGPCLRAFAGELAAQAPPEEEVYGNVLYYMQAVHGRMQYLPDSTSVTTTAEAALKSGFGVCQDYSHVLLSLLRSRGIAARYVVGMMAGEGASHAWVEANCRGWWYGLDPTNNRLVDEQYIKLSHGRDFQDCIVNKGVFRNICLEQKRIRLAVAEIQKERIDYHDRNSCIGGAADQ